MTTIEQTIRDRFAQYTDFTEPQINMAIKTIIDALQTDLSDDIVITTEDAIDERIDDAINDVWLDTRLDAWDDAMTAIEVSASERDWIKPDCVDAFFKRTREIARSGC